MEYFGYIDWDTLALLFGLMAVMKGFQRAGLFDILANKLLKRANTSRKLMFVLVFLPFFLSFSPAAPSGRLSYRSFLRPPVFAQKKKTCAFSSEKTHAFWHILMDLLYNLPLQNAYFFLRFCGFPIRLPARIPSSISIRPSAGFVKFF